MSLRKQIKVICKNYSILPLRKQGQNFLINPYVIKKIINTADLNKNDKVLEIGSGFGALTIQIAQHVKKIIGIEINKKIFQALKEQVKDYKNIIIIQDDILKVNINDLKLKNYKYKIIANLPFNITGLVLKQFLSQKPKPESMILILQKQVGQRIVAKPGKMSLLSCSVQFYSSPYIVYNISKNNFYPKPKVDSILIKLNLFKKPLFKNEARFFNIIKAGFLHPRKYVINNLIKSGIINKEDLIKIFNILGLNTKIRAQELSINDWIKLTNSINK